MYLRAGYAACSGRTGGYPGAQRARGTALRARRDIYNRNSIPPRETIAGGGAVKDNTGMKRTSGFPACCGVVTDG